MHDVTPLPNKSVITLSNEEEGISPATCVFYCKEKTRVLGGRMDNKMSLTLI